MFKAIVAAVLLLIVVVLIFIALTAVIGWSFGIPTTPKTGIGVFAVWALLEFSIGHWFKGKGKK